MRLQTQNVTPHKTYQCNNAESPTAKKVIGADNKDVYFSVSSKASA